MSAARVGSCADCRHFNGRPADIEAALPGLSSLSSAYAAVRAEDGICAVHERYVAASSVCALHMSATTRARDAPVLRGEALKSPRPAPDNRRRSDPFPYQ
jgi:hypothetical protein